MSSAQKTPLSWSLPALVDKKIREYIGQLGSSLPGHVLAVNGAIVTVAFDVTPGVLLPQVTLPLAGPEYVRMPIRAASDDYAGDLGVCMPINAYIGATSGLGTASQTSLAQANLSNLVWFPIGNKNWSEVDPNAVTLYGPNGVVTRDTESKSVTTLTPDGITTTTQGTYDVTSNDDASISADTSLTLTGGGHSIVISDAGVEIDGVLFLPHTHSLVQTGGDDSGPVVP